eukprot:5971299-Pleurochrysis_carterae.AAC.1
MALAAITTFRLVLPKNILLSRACEDVQIRTLRVTAATMATTTRLKVGDTVSVPVSVFGQEYARSRGGSTIH